MKNFYIRLVLLLVMTEAFSVARAQPGGWSINPKNYQFTMSMVARIETDSMPNNALNNHVAAFSGNQIRGYATPVQAGGGQALYFMNLYANTYLDAKFYFLAYIGDVAKVYESQDTVVFLHHKQVGTLQQPLVLYFSLSPRPLIYSVADVRYEESTCTPGFLVNIEASDNEDSEGNGLKYRIVGGADSSRFQVDSLSGELRWKNFTPDFENPEDADGDNIYLVDVQVRDLDGFSSVQTIAVTVTDDSPPSATCPAAIVANTGDDGPGDCSTTVPGPISVGTPANCATYLVGYQLEGATTGQGMGQVPPNQPFNSGKTTVRYTVTDDSGTLSKTCSFTVTVRDNEPPTVTCPNTVAVGTDFGACSAVPSGTDVSVLDNCDNPTISHAMTGATTGSSSGQVPANQVFAAGTTTIAYTVQETGDTTKYTCSFTVTVTDNQNPSLTCPANKNATLLSGCNTTQTGTAATVSDNCSGFLLTYALSGATTGSGSGQVPGGQKFQSGVTTVLYTATDGDGSGASTCSFTITVVETLKPTVACPPNANVTVGANCQTILEDYRLKANISDNCTPDSALLIVQEPVPGTILNGLGTTTVKITATDLSGNSRHCTLNVTVKDTPLFDIACPGNQQVCDGVIGDYRVLGQLTAGCSGALPPITQDPMPGGAIPVFNSTVTITLSASNGVKTANCTFTVAWRDTLAPQAQCKPATAVVQANGEATVAVSDVENGSTDNCGVQGAMLSKALFTCLDVGENTVTLTVTDVNGVTGTCTATVTVNDPNAVCCALPQAICKTNPTVYLDGNGQAAIAVADVDDGSTWDCGLQSAGVSPTSTSCSQVGTPLLVTLTVTDINARTSSCLAMVAVADTVAPTARCQNTTVYLDHAGNGSTTTAAVGNGSADNCGIGSLELSRTNFTCTDAGPNAVTLTATDASNNTATCTATVAVLDTIRPTVVCIANQNKNTDPGGCTYTVPGTAFQPVSYGDNCGQTTLWNNFNQTASLASAVFPKGATTVAWTVSDAANNTVSCQFVVTVSDVEPPSITCPGGLTVSCAGEVPAPNLNQVVATDNCGTPTKSHVGDATTNMTCVNRKTVTRTYRATDGSGNSTTCSQVITVLDNIQPTFTFVPANVTVQCNSVPAVGNPTATDGCGGSVTITYNGQTVWPGLPRRLHAHAPVDGHRCLRQHPHGHAAHQRD
jgi:large repetitive protein